jgi:hypothetical protein
VLDVAAQRLRGHGAHLRGPSSPAARRIAPTHARIAGRA